jgi:uncharacterized iron-regulated membrane protein
MRYVRVVATAGFAAICTGCGTSINVVASPNANLGAVHTAYLVVHEAPPSDMDLKVEMALKAQSVEVVKGKADSSGGSDLLVKYDDKWNWDMAMYLRALEMQFFDGRTGEVLATSQWTDGALHGYRDSGRAAAELVAETFKKLGVPPVAALAPATK